MRSPRVAPPTPLALLRGAATVLPARVIAGLAAAVMRSLRRTHPKLLANLAQLAPGTVHILPTDLPYGFELTVGRAPIVLTPIERDAGGADASVAASIATLLDLLEGRIDSDTLFFRRDLIVSGNTAVIVGLRNVLDRDELNVGDEIAAAFGPLGPPSRAAARVLNRALDGLGARVAAMHRALHPSRADSTSDVSADLERCRAEVAALTARLGRLEARQQRRDEKAL
jgi:predicted lipid carrier protein YhbT